MTPTNKLLLTVLTIALAIYGFQYIGNSVTFRTQITAKQIERMNP
jgi:hypothetical protein